MLPDLRVLPLESRDVSVGNWTSHSVHLIIRREDEEDPYREIIHEAVVVSDFGVVCAGKAWPVRVQIKSGGNLVTRVTKGQGVVFVVVLSDDFHHVFDVHDTLRVTPEDGGARTLYC